MIEKELLMHAIAYNAIRALILRSAMEHQQELGRISFKGAVDCCTSGCRMPQRAMTSHANWCAGTES